MLIGKLFFGTEGTAMYITNAFSLNMVTTDFGAAMWNQVDLGIAQILAKHGVQSAVGHAETARLFSAVLGVEVPMDRVTLELYPDDTILVGQYKGPRLPEGVTELPEGATLKWFLVTIR